MDVILFALMFFLVLLLGIYLLIHIFYSLGLVAIARHRQIPRAALAWIPFIGTAYMTGAIADDQDRRVRNSDYGLRYWLLGTSVILLILTVVLLALLFRTGTGYADNTEDPVYLMFTFITLIVGLPFTALWYLAHFKLYKACQPNNSVAFLLLSIFVGLAPFLVFAVRHYADGERVCRVLRPD